MQLECLLPHSQEPPTCPCPEPYEQSVPSNSAPLISIFILSSHLFLGFQVLSSFHVSLPTPSMHYVIHALLISSWTNHEAPRYAVFLSPKKCQQPINVVTCLQMAVLTGHTGMITAVHFCPMARGNIRYLVSTSSDGSVSFWSYNRLGPGKYTFLWVFNALAVFTLGSGKEDP
jgi:WD40 repeat protein